MKLQKIINELEKIAPKHLAEEWDNVGLMIGDVDSEINKILIALDFNSLVLDEAIRMKADLIITHHPVIFNPLKSVTDKNILNAIQNKISIYSMHTNLDNAVNGVNYALAEILNLYNCSQSGMIRWGYCEEKTLAHYVELVKSKLKTDSVRVVGDNNKSIKKIAVLGGSGGSFVEQVCSLGCDLYITGECAYNYAQDAFENDLCVIAAGHFETENPVVNKLKKMLELRIDVEIFESETENVYKSR